MSLKMTLGMRALTVKLRGRAPTPAKRRGRTLSFSARGAKQITPHGPLQRLLDDACAKLSQTKQQTLRPGYRLIPAIPAQ
jgi:hypothetical protein